jgi:leader peptidase (prepilin peptidase)/N-methyltransferase
MWELEQAIAEWRKQMLAVGIKSPVPLEELESHLRDDVEQQVQSGANKQQAFEAAVQRVGQGRELKCEFMKVGGTWQVLQRKIVWASLGVAFLGCWMVFGHSPAMALVYGVLLAGLIVASFIDLKHLIIPDEITFGGIVAGLVFSFVLPQLHGQKTLLAGILQGLLGCGIGAGLLYFVLRVGKLAFGPERLGLPGETKIIFTETALVLPEKEMPYAELFYRRSDVIAFLARTAEFAGRSYQDVPVRLTPTRLQIGEDQFYPGPAMRLEAVSSEIVLPREAMGMGDVKFMAAIGAFLGWQAVIFSLMASSIIGSLAGVALIATRRREWSSQLPYGPFIALAAAIWIFGGQYFIETMFTH